MKRLFSLLVFSGVCFALQSCVLDDNGLFNNNPYYGPYGNRGGYGNNSNLDSNREMLAYNYGNSMGARDRRAGSSKNASRYLYQVDKGFGSEYRRAYLHGYENGYAATRTPAPRPSYKPRPRW